MRISGSSCKILICLALEAHWIYLYCLQLSVVSILLFFCWIREVFKVLGLIEGNLGLGGGWR
jgi:hypothetical protein